MPAKQEIVDTIREKIERWKADVDHFQARADQIANADLRAYGMTVKEILSIIQQVENRYKAIDDSTIGTWKELIESAETADRQIKDRLKRARRKFLS